MSNKKKFTKFSHSKDEFLCYNTCPNNVIVVSDNLTTTNMDPCENINYCTCVTEYKLLYLCD